MTVSDQTFIGTVCEGTKKGTYRLSLKRLNRLDLRSHIVGDRLEVAEDLLSLVDDSLVAENGAVVVKVNGRGLGCELGLDTLCVPVPLAERLEGRDGLCRVE